MILCSHTHRFLIEDSTFYICDKSYNLDFDFSDYVSVMDMGMFQLSLKMTDHKDEIEEPQVFMFIYL